MTKYNKYPVPSDYVTKKQLDKLADKVSQHSEHEGKKRKILADKIRTLAAEIAALKAVSLLLEEDLQRSRE